MRFFDKLSGTKRPDGGVPPRLAEEVRASLLDLNGPEVPYVIRDGNPEGADLVAEWRVMEPAWHRVFSTTQVSRLLQIHLRLVAEDNEVRALDQQWEVTWVDGAPQLSRSAEYSRGQVNTSTRRWTLGKGDDGRLGMTETFRFDSSDLKDPLQDAVLNAGWTWRGVTFGKL